MLHNKDHNIIYHINNNNPSTMATLQQQPPAFSHVTTSELLVTIKEKNINYYQTLLANIFFFQPQIYLLQPMHCLQLILNKQQRFCMRCPKRLQSSATIFALEYSITINVLFRSIHNLGSISPTMLKCNLWAGGFGFAASQSCPYSPGIQPHDWSE